MCGALLLGVFMALGAGIGSLARCLLGGAWASFQSLLQIRPGETKRAVVALLALMVLIGSGVSLYKRCRNPSSQIQTDVLLSFGEVAAEETVQLLGGKGRVVVLRLTTGNSNDRIKKIQALRLKGFERAFKSHRQVRIIAVKDVVVDEKFSETGIVFPPQRYREVLDAYPEADAIVCLAGNPFSSLPDFAKWPERRPKCVLLEIIPQGAKALIAKGAVDVAFVMCQSSTLGAGPPATPREWFDRMYQVVNRSNYMTLDN
jgi:hypothetical protein